jgi:hypothetical protein
VLHDSACIDTAGGLVFERIVVAMHGSERSAIMFGISSRHSRAGNHVPQARDN